jgi:hypothetical protein
LISLVFYEINVYICYRLTNTYINMKKTMVAVLTALAMVGCSADHSEPIQGSKSVTFHVYEQEAMSRAALADACSSINYYRYVGGELANSIAQTSADEDFGTITDKMDYGTHELYFIGHKAGSVTMTDGVATFDKVNDTFSYYASVVVDEDSDPSMGISMPRRVAKFELVTTDALPTTLSTVVVTITGAATTLDVKSGLGASVATQTKTITVPASNIGKTNCTFGSYVFLPDGVNAVNVNYTFKDANGSTMAEHTFSDVPMATNYITRYTGNAFSDDFNGAVTAQNEWGGENDFSF